MARRAQEQTPERRTRRLVGIGPVLDHWRAERRTIRQGLGAMVVASIGNLTAGFALGAITGTLEQLPGLMVLLPAAIAMRGNIFGALGSRLGTSVHAGIFEASGRRGSILQQNVWAATILTFAVSLLLGVLAKIMAEAFGVRTMSVADFVAISVLAGIISSIIVGAFTAVLAVQGYRREWDLDSVTAPLVTAMGDVITIPSLFVASFVAGIPVVTPLVAGASAVVGVGLGIRGVVTNLEITRRVCRESLPLLAMAGTVDLFAGIAVEARLEDFVEFPVLLVLVPPVLAGAGALGGILSSRLASKLHLGSLYPKGLPAPLALLDTTIVLLFAVFLFPALGASADLVGGLLGLDSPGMPTVVGVTSVAGMTATGFAIVVAYYAAVASFRLGLDPDSIGIPMITASMDLVGAIALIMSLVLFGLT